MKDGASPAASAGTADRSFREYKVVARRDESRIITSLVLAPADGAEAPGYRPGQHLVFRLKHPQGGNILRHYSVSGDPADRGLLRISVKREPAPPGRPELPAGLGSAYMHDHAQVGDVLAAAGPMGGFVLDEDSDRPVLLLSAGVGLTPMMAMLYRLVRGSGRRVYFLHACESGEVHAFAGEVLALAASRPGVMAHFRYRCATDEDLAQGRCHSRGLVDKELLQSLLPLDDYDVYLCGPPPFMQAGWRLLRGLGIAPGRIHYEFFGPATVLEDDGAANAAAASAARGVAPQFSVAERAPAAAESAPPQEEGVAAVPATGAARVDMQAAGPAAGQPPASAPSVRFGPAGVEVPWDDACPSLLDLAERAGLNPDFNCRAGLCGTCMSTLVSGTVEYFEEPLDPPPEGKVLLCCSRPLGPVAIDLAR
jgi:ferredoxin-NADP reductase/ferredoxin